MFKKKKWKIIKRIEEIDKLKKLLPQPIKWTPKRPEVAILEEKNDKT